MNARHFLPASGAFSGLKTATGAFGGGGSAPPDAGLTPPCWRVRPPSPSPTGRTNIKPRFPSMPPPGPGSLQLLRVPSGLKAEEHPSPAVPPLDLGVLALPPQQQSWAEGVEAAEGERRAGVPPAGQPEVTHRPEQDVSREPSAPSACSPLKAGRCRERAQAGRERGSLSTLRGPGPQHLRGRAPPTAGAEAPGGRLMDPSSPLSAILGPRAGARRLLLGPWSSRWGDPPSTPRSLPLHDTLRDTRHGTPGRPSRAADACHELFKASPVPPR